MACKCWQMRQSGFAFTDLEESSKNNHADPTLPPSSPSQPPPTYQPTHRRPTFLVCKPRRRPPPHHLLRLSKVQYCESQMTLKCGRYKRLRLHSLPNPPSTPLICRPIAPPSGERPTLSKVINVEVSLPGLPRVGRPPGPLPAPRAAWLSWQPGIHLVSV